VITAQRALAAAWGGRLPPEWTAAFKATPRQVFIPDRAWRLPRGGGAPAMPIDRHADPRAWLEAVHSADIIVTQLDDGLESGAGKYTSSCPMPHVVGMMLRHLDARHGHRVLEIGTGTGWNAAILAAYLGADNVVSVEVDPLVADRARANLARMDRQITVVTADGAQGYPPGAPYDRLEATCSVGTVPYPWVEQTRTGGIILTPWGPPFDNNHLLRLHVDDGMASGTIVDWAAFMRLRGQRWTVTDEPADFADIAQVSRAVVDPRELLGDDAQLAVGLHLGQCRAAYDHAEDGSLDTLWLLAVDSWASVRGDIVRQAGARRLWDEALRGYQWWIDHERPARTRFGMTVTRQRQWVWLDNPDTVVVSSGTRL
jgi:protein-L-isoaspartate(D-aspartate) O-methyltransferase